MTFVNSEHNERKEKENKVKEKLDIIDVIWILLFYQVWNE